MDRSSLLRTVAIFFAVVLFWKYGLPAITGKSEAVQQVPKETYANAPGVAPDVVDEPAPGQPVPVKPPEGELCTLHGNRFDAVLSTRGAALTHFYLRDPRYAGTDGFDMSTTPDVERWRSLRTLFRNGEDGPIAQLAYDRVDWKLETLPDQKGCRFAYEDEGTRIVKTVAAGERPFELNVETSLTNLSEAPKRHRFSIEAFAYRQNKELKGHLGRVSPFQTDLACARDKEVARKSPDDFKTGWFSEPLIDRYAAVSNYYFTQAVVPLDAEDGTEGKPECDLLAEQWYSSWQKPTDDEAGYVFHARLLYPVVELAPNKTAKYSQISYLGPKERGVLAKAAGGTPRLGDLINLGFFSPVAKVLVDVLVFFHDHVTFGSWGLAIIGMTLCLRLLLFPLSVKMIQNQVAMRRLKPEIDSINAKFKDDMQAKSMATMELHRKHGINMFGGCLPQLIAMPVWWAMYTTLQTAVEMYHEKFLWFTDLSAPDKIFVLPVVLGGFMIVQQRIVPQQGMDPMQQKMMMYVMPLGLTVMMLFLPAALGLYMLTSSVLGIGQQLVIERIAPRTPPETGKGSPQAKNGQIIVKQVSSPKGAGRKADRDALGKDKASV
jgi:YidC/Oxa1 family membrane protein insertase